MFRVRSRDSSFLITVVAACLAFSASLALLRENLKLSAELERSGGGLSGPAGALPGDIVPPFRAIDLDGREKIVSYFGGSHKGYVLLFFSPKCRVCEKQFPIWTRLFGGGELKCYDVLAVSLDPLEETRAWAQNRELKYAVISLPNQAYWRAYRITAVPHTVVVSSEGTVIWAHSGLLREGEAAHELLAVINRCDGRAP
jgi:peroxiredoxin